MGGDETILFTALSFFVRCRLFDIILRTSTKLGYTLWSGAKAISRPPIWYKLLGKPVIDSSLSNSGPREPAPFFHVRLFPMPLPPPDEASRSGNNANRMFRRFRRERLQE